MPLVRCGYKAKTCWTVLIPGRLRPDGSRGPDTAGEVCKPKGKYKCSKGGWLKQPGLPSDLSTYPGGPVAESTYPGGPVTQYNLLFETYEWRD